MSADEGLAGDVVTAEACREKIERNRADFLKVFGGLFEEREITGFWFGPSPTGEHVGMLFILADGSQQRVTMRLDWLQRFGDELIFAAESAAERVDELAQARAEIAEASVEG